MNKEERLKIFNNWFDSTLYKQSKQIFIIF